MRGCRRRYGVPQRLELKRLARPMQGSCLGRRPGVWLTSGRLPLRHGEARARSGGDGAGEDARALVRQRALSRCAIGRRSHDRLSSARCRRSASLARDHARLPRRTSAPQQGPALSADPPTVEEIVAVMREASDDRHGYRLRALIVVLWRGGLRVAEALSLGERDLDPRRGSLLVRNRREAPGPRGVADWPGFLPPPVEPCMRFSRTRLTDVVHRRHSASPARPGRVLGATTIPSRSISPRWSGEWKATTHQPSARARWCRLADEQRQPRQRVDR